MLLNLYRGFKMYIKANDCLHKYEEMLTQRLSDPFESSLYKLKEQKERLTMSIEEIDRITDVNKGSLESHDLQYCTIHDIGIYLESIPINLSSRLGHHVALGIDGLIGNGVDKAKIKQIKATYTPLIEELVKDCDKQKNWIRGDITYEYDDLINGRSKLRDLVIRALFIVDSIIADAGF